LLAHLEKRCPAFPSCLLQGLSREEIEEIQRGLQPTLKAGQRLRLEEQVDPSIIGGVILSIGDKYVDMSILARVKKLQQIVRDAV
jgi:F-type H+-transporting ATPase subunit O